MKGLLGNMLFGNRLFWVWGNLDCTWMEEGIVSSLGRDFLYFSCFQRSSGICWVGALAPQGMTEKKKPWRKYGQYFKKSWVVLLSHCMNSAGGRNYRAAEVSFSPHPVVPRVQPSPAGPFFCLVLVAPSLICRETGTLCQSSSRFNSPLSPADIQSANYHRGQQEANEEGTEIPVI